MLSFRQKVFAAYLVVFLLFLACLFPVTERIVDVVVRKQLVWWANELIKSVSVEPGIDVAIEKLHTRQSLFFARVTLLNDEGGVLYDSHTEQVLGRNFERGYLTRHPEVLEALEHGIGYTEGYSTILGENFFYTAKAFMMDGEGYVIRTAFPSKQINNLVHEFQLALLFFGVVILSLFGVLTWLIISNLSRPIYKIIKIAKAYKPGKGIPRIDFGNTVSPKDDFFKLAKTLNSLSEQVKYQIDLLTYEKNEKTKILETLSEGVIAVNKEGIVNFVNSTAEKILTCSSYRLIDGRLDMYEDDLSQQCHQLLQCAIKGEQVSVEEFKGHSGELLDIIATPKDNGAILVLQDKTNNYHLMDMHRAFVANASHELRTPITIIQGFAEAIHDNEGLARDSVVSSTDKIINNCFRMSNLVRNLLTLSDIENIPNTSLEVCDIPEIIMERQDDLLKIYPDTRFSNDFNGGIQFLGDPELLGMAVKNLMENAIKYSEDSAEINVGVSEGRDRIILEISDKGMGISEKEQEKIFRRFYTVDKARTRRLGGAGLGLSIVESIVRKHKGKIVVESSPGIGTAFIITLPCKF
jgi:two-component system, OmpR family, phosphate regulon sensor histidine kinase PhoR